MLDFAIFSETKLSSFNNFKAKSLWSLSHTKWLALDSNENSKGILIMWNDFTYKYINTIKGNYTLSAQFKDDTSLTWCG